VSRSLIQICLLAVMLLPAVGQAQFNFTTNTDGSLNSVWPETPVI
jgi:hypothetical protein